MISSHSFPPFWSKWMEFREPVTSPMETMCITEIISILNQRGALMVKNIYDWCSDVLADCGPGRV